MGFHKMRPQPLQHPLWQFPTQIGPWNASQQDYFNQELLGVLKPNDYLMRRYVGPSNQSIDLYIGYHDKAQGSGPIHSPKNCLPGNGWLEVASNPLVVDIRNKKIHLTQAVYNQGEKDELFLYWYMVRGDTISTEIGLKLAEISNAIRHGQGGASFVRISISVKGDVSQASATAISFLKLAFPEVRSFLATQ